MVEVLVASTILIVIVMLLSMLFQQTGLAWRAGVKRADGFVGMRAMIGAIQHDASAMIDISCIPVALRDGDQQFTSTSLKFYTLNTAFFYDDKNMTPGTALRALRYITYDASGNRHEYVREVTGWQEMGNGANIINIVNRTGNKNKAVPKIDAFEYDYGNQANQIGLPAYLTVKAQVTTTGNSLDIGAASAGPDKIWDTTDDIVTWTKK